MKPIELEQLAVMFRVNDPNLHHCTTLDAMTQAGLAYSYGIFRGIPRRHTVKRSRMREIIALALERKAKGLS